MHYSLWIILFYKNFRLFFIQFFLQFFTNCFYKKSRDNFLYKILHFFYSFLQNPAGTFFTILLQFFTIFYNCKKKNPCAMLKSKKKQMQQSRLITTKKPGLLKESFHSKEQHYTYSNAIRIRAGPRIRT